MYGAAFGSFLDKQWEEGLSPRVRGSPLFFGRDGLLVGSIPACTGQPPSPRRCSHTAAVYPRVYGAAAVRFGAAISVTGLSPRVRGSRCRIVPARCWRRSIPACTGQPRSANPLSSAMGVYPRVYGAAVSPPE